jgi:hypothetical protein
MDRALGVEVELAVLAKLSVGVFQGIGDDRSTRLTWSVGRGF